MIYQSSSDRQAVRLLQIYMLLMFLVPSALVFAPLGAAGGPATLMGLILMAWWAIQFISGGLVGSRWSPASVALLIFTLTNFAGYASGQLHGLSGKQALAADRGLITVVSLLGLGLTASAISSRHAIDRVLKSFVLGTAGISVMALAQSYLGFDISLLRIPGLSANGIVDTQGQRSDFVRVAATTGHPIELGVLLAVAIPIAVHYALSVPLRSPQVLYRWGLLLPMIPALLLTVSRAALLGLVVAFALLALGWHGTRRMGLLIIAPMAIVAIRFTMPGILGTLQAYFLQGSNDPSVQGRLDDYPAVVERVTGGPLLGTGFGTLLPKEFRILDNQYLGIVVESGFPALVALVGVFASAYFSARGVRLRGDRATSDLGLALSASIAVLAVSYAFFDAFAFRTSLALIPFLTGISGALWVITGGFVRVHPRVSESPSDGESVATRMGSRC